MDAAVLISTAVNDIILDVVVAHETPLRTDRDSGAILTSIDRIGKVVNGIVINPVKRRIGKDAEAAGPLVTWGRNRRVLLVKDIIPNVVVTAIQLHSVNWIMHVGRNHPNHVVADVPVRAGDYDSVVAGVLHIVFADHTVVQFSALDAFGANARTDDIAFNDHLLRSPGTLRFDPMAFIIGVAPCVVQVTATDLGILCTKIATHDDAAAASRWIEGNTHAARGDISNFKSINRKSVAIVPCGNPESKCVCIRFVENGSTASP